MFLEFTHMFILLHSWGNEFHEFSLNKEKLLYISYDFIFQTLRNNCLFPIFTLLVKLVHSCSIHTFHSHTNSSHISTPAVLFQTKIEPILCLFSCTSLSSSFHQLMNHHPTLVLFCFFLRCTHHSICISLCKSIQKTSSHTWPNHTNSFTTAYKGICSPTCTYVHCQVQNHCFNDPLLLMWVCCISQVCLGRKEGWESITFFSEKNVKLGRSGFQSLLCHSQAYLTLGKLLNLSEFNSPHL